MGLIWTYGGKEFTEEHVGDYVGFVYLITCKTNKKKYIGKKLFKFSRSKIVKGKKKRAKVTSDWEKYYGSNETLKEDVKLLGADKFKREVLHLCVSKSECNYYEAKEQFIRGVLEDANYYNNWISVRVTKAHLKLC